MHIKSERGVELRHLQRLCEWGAEIRKKSKHIFFHSICFTSSLSVMKQEIRCKRNLQCPIYTDNMWACLIVFPERHSLLYSNIYFSLFEGRVVGFSTLKLAGIALQIAEETFFYIEMNTIFPTLFSKQISYF